MALTRRQRQIYDFIRDYVSTRGYSPSLEEIGAHFGLSSVATVHKHVQHLVEKRYLKKAWNRSRSVEPVEPPNAGVVPLPLVGVVAAIEVRIDVDRHARQAVFELVPLSVTIQVIPRETMNLAQHIVSSQQAPVFQRFMMQGVLAVTLITGLVDLPSRVEC